MEHLIALNARRPLELAQRLGVASDEPSAACPQNMCAAEP
jgi:hypothetical protein